MASRIKTDNVSLASKVAIRCWLLDRLSITDAYVLDTCAGAGRVWAAMEDHVAIRQWTRCDVKPRGAGTLALSALDAVRRFPLDTYNVVDIDPYGEPWAPYRALLARLTRPVAVFLTHGHVRQSAIQSATLDAIGLPSSWPVPRTPSLSAFVAQMQLEQTWRHADIQHAAQIRFPRVTYYALGLAPMGE